jgi:hypothetical protein
VATGPAYRVRSRWLDPNCGEEFGIEETPGIVRQRMLETLGAA